MIKARDITLSYGKRNIIEGASFDIEPKVMISPSGSEHTSVIAKISSVVINPSASCNVTSINDIRMFL